MWMLLVPVWVVVGWIGRRSGGWKSPRVDRTFIILLYLLNLYSLAYILAVGVRFLFAIGEVTPLRIMSILAAASFSVSSLLLLRKFVKGVRQEKNPQGTSA